MPALPPDPARPSRRHILLLTGLTLLLVVPSMFTRDPWNPDEPRYLEVAREMVERGTLKAHFVMHLNGEVYPEKPPLFFWLTGLAWRLGAGLNSGRVVVALAAMATVLLLYLSAVRRLGRRAALWAALTMLTSLLFLDLVRAGVIDPLLMCFTTSAILLGFSAMERRATRWRWPAAYAAAGLAILTKGHVGFFIPLVVLLIYGLWHRRNVHAGGWIHLPGALLMLAFVAAWLVPAGMLVGWDYVRTLTIDQVVRRAVESESHRAPFYYFIVQYPWLFYPWCLLFIPAAISAVSAWRRERNRDALFFLVWFFGVFVFFSAISGKRVGYLLPLVPAFGLLMGRYLRQGIAEGWPRSRLHLRLLRATFIFGLVATLLAIAVVVLAGGFPGATARLAPRYSETLETTARNTSTAALATAVLPLLALAATNVWGTVRGWRRAGPLPLAVLVAVIVAHSLHADLFLMPTANEFKSGRIFGEKAKAAADRAEEVFFYSKPFFGMYNIYLARTAVPVLEGARAFRTALDTDRPVAVITCARFHDEESDPSLDRYHVLVRRLVGHRIMLLVGNDALKRLLFPHAASEAGRTD